MPIFQVDRLRYLHEHGLIFHDVKPTNFVIGGTEDTVNKVFLIGKYDGYLFNAKGQVTKRSEFHKLIIFFVFDLLPDFGFSKTYLDEFGRSKPRELTKHHHGTPEYMGLAPLMNYTQVRKDDLISLGLTLLDVHGVTLPWMELPELDDIWAAMASVLQSWQTTDMEVSGYIAPTRSKIYRNRSNFSKNMFFFQDLCWKTQAPETFVRYFHYLDSLNSQDTPDYEHLKHILGRTLTKQDIQEMDLGFTNWDKEPVRY